MTYVSFRKCEAYDLLKIQTCNIQNLPENYNYKYYLFHYISWPDCSFVAEINGNIVAYVLTKIEEESNEPHGHITSLAVDKEFRRRYIAESLMKIAQQSLFDLHKDIKFISLHVRKSNTSAINLYTKKLGFVLHSTEIGYYADGEDGLVLRKYK